MAKIETYRDLIVWQKSMTLVYRATKVFPREEVFGLTAQMHRSAVSIPSNIAEGHGRAYTADYLRFLAIAIGSLFELQTQLQIALNLGYLAVKHYDECHDLTLELERMLSSLQRKLAR